jgi:Ca2+-transporting ATPase
MFFGVVLSGVLGLAGESGETVILPLLATQILWINLVTDGPPALALGLDPGDPDVMNQPPRQRDSGVITRQMWIGIVFVGLIMAVGTLGVLDAALPGGLIAGSGPIAYGRTMAFTTLMLFQLFNVFNARSDTASAFRMMMQHRHNLWLWGALVLVLALQLLVVYAPPLQRAFSTVSLSGGDWLRCGAVASSVLWLREASKLLARRRASPAQPVPVA